MMADLSANLDVSESHLTNPVTLGILESNPNNVLMTMCPPTITAIPLSSSVRGLRATVISPTIFPLSIFNGIL